MSDATGGHLVRAWAERDEDLCRAPCLVSDDHWGAITQTCDLVRGHGGEHAASLTGCIPEAALCWPQTDLHDPPKGASRDGER